MLACDGECMPQVDSQQEPVTRSYQQLLEKQAAEVNRSLNQTPQLVHFLQTSPIASTVKGVT